MSSSAESGMNERQKLLPFTPNSVGFPPCAILILIIHRQAAPSRGLQVHLRELGEPQLHVGGALQPRAHVLRALLPHLQQVWDVSALVKRLITNIEILFFSFLGQKSLRDRFFRYRETRLSIERFMSP